jgi:hypothetical protein
MRYAFPAESRTWNAATGADAVRAIPFLQGTNPVQGA